ncbi:nascent polypeptide-associated complex protein [Candidatus Micrarchaeota archaeon]|nr:nascent polypeptide-associated complex protein [Candidatus Micrarchaeota archaeon]
MLGGGMDPRQMKRMMQQMGINSTDISAKRVIIESEESNIILENPSVTKISAQGQISYQISGDEKVEEKISKEDIQIVMEQTNVDHEKAEKALKEKNGDIAEAILYLQEDKSKD